MNRFMMIGFISLVLVGCSNAHSEKSWLRDQAKDYQYSYQGNDLRIPSGLEPLPYDEHYEIQPLKNTQVEEVSLIPPGVGL